MKSMYKIPEGTYDFLPQECFIKNALEDKLLNTFINRGFKKINTPILERYELFANNFGNVPMENLFKITDYDGGLLVLRPDMTMPIARVINTKMPGVEDAKFCYVANSFSPKIDGARLREFTQAGVEIFAPNSAYVDADCIALAIRALLESGLSDFQVDIGNVEFFKGLLLEMDLSDELMQELVSLVDAKDSFGIELFAKKFDIDRAKLHSILSLPTLFGGREVFDLAYQHATNVRSKSALDNLINIYDILVEMGFENYISFDLSLVNGFSYYSGVIFKGITRYFGAPILSGGRYDNLSKAFNKKNDATGFAIGVNHLLQAIRNQSGEYAQLPQVDVLVGGEKESFKTINRFINEMIDDGKIVENSYIHNLEEFKEKFKPKSVKKAVFIDKNGVVTEFLREELYGKNSHSSSKG